MAYPNRISNYLAPGNANPIYSSVSPDYLNDFAANGYFVWTKSLAGYPWDVKSFDTKYVYDRTTELTWGDPTSFKRFNQDLPMTQRCVKLGKAGKSIKVSQTATAYGFYSQCANYQTGTLKYALNTLTAPKLVNAGGNLGQVATRTFKYHYGCDSTYSNCSDLEVFSLGYEVGLYDWKHYTNVNGKWVLQQDSQINTASTGQTTAYLPCPQSYE